MNFLRVPEVHVENAGLEKPLFTSGRLSRIGMLPESEVENFSDDELSVDVPTGSPVSSVHTERSKDTKLDNTDASSTDLDNYSGNEQNASDCLSDNDETDGSEADEGSNPEGEKGGENDMDESEESEADSESEASHWEETDDELLHGTSEGSDSDFENGRTNCYDKQRLEVENKALGMSNFIEKGKGNTFTENKSGVTINVYEAVKEKPGTTTSVADKRKHSQPHTEKLHNQSLQNESVRNISDNTESGERVVSVSNVLLGTRSALSANDDIKSDITGTFTPHSEEFPHIEISDWNKSQDDSDLSPLSPSVDFDFSRRRSSFIRVKMEGRRRQRLSVTESVSEHVLEPESPSKQDASDTESSSVFCEPQEKCEPGNSQNDLTHDKEDPGVSQQPLPKNSVVLPASKTEHYIQTEKKDEKETSLYVKKASENETKEEDVQTSATAKSNTFSRRKSGSDNNKNRPTSAPILNKRSKIKQRTFKASKTDRAETSSITSITSYTSVKTMPLTLQRGAKKDTRSQRISPITKKRNPNNTDAGKFKTPTVTSINDLHADLVNIYNSISSKNITERLEHSMEERSTNSKDNAPYKKYADTSNTPEPTNTACKDEHYFEGYHLLKSGNQTFPTEACVTDINQMIVKTRTSTESDQHTSKQFITDPVTNTNNKDNNLNVESKPLLLPDANETGNCEIKTTCENYAADRDRFSRNCDDIQLSSRADGPENGGEIGTFSSDTSVSHNSRRLKKRQTYENLFEGKLSNASFLRTSLREKVKREFKTDFAEVVNETIKALDINDDLSTKDVNYTSKMDGGRQIGTSTPHDAIRRVQLTYKPGSAASLGERRGRTPTVPGIYVNSEEGEDGHTLQRTQSTLADTARLNNIRRLLRLSDDNSDRRELERKRETELIIKEIIDGILTAVCRHRERKHHSVTKTHRCTKQESNGDETLCCLLQATSSIVDPTCYTCDVIDAVDVAPVTGKHECLVSNIVKVSIKPSSQDDRESAEIFVTIPIAHWYVEPWQELVIRSQENNVHWRDRDVIPDVVAFDDNGKTMYGVRHHATNSDCTIAVVTRPRVTDVTVTKCDVTTEAVTDARVKIYTFYSEVKKAISLQVVPVDQRTLAEFQDKTGNKTSGIVTASSPLLVIKVKDNGEAESLAFDVPYESMSARNERKPSRSESIPPSRRSSEQTTVDIAPYRNANLLVPPTAPRRTSIASPFHKGESGQSLFHLVQATDDGDVRIKLIENNGKDKEVKKTCDAVFEDSVRFSLYDRQARVVAVETRGLVDYPDVQKLTGAFVNYITKHRVKLRLAQDPRDLYSVLFTALAEHAHRPEMYALTQAYKHFTSTSFKEILIEEGEIVAIVFRGNVDVPERDKLIFSFHGYRGIHQHFDILVPNPQSQRSLQTYHGALQVFILKTQRFTAVDRTQAPCAKNGWELSAEFPLLLPKYTKTTPVIINKAPVSLRFHEPLTVDFLRTLCLELQNDWVQFAHALGMTHARIQAIKLQHRNQQTDKILMDVMISWMKTRTITQDKVAPVIAALRRCNQKKLASELARRQLTLKQSKNNTATEKSLQRAFSFLKKSTMVAARWRQLLHHLFDVDSSDVVEITKEIDEKYNDESSRCQGALYHWKSTTAAPSVWKLVDALRACRCDIAAEYVVSMEAKRRHHQL